MADRRISFGGELEPGSQYSSSRDVSATSSKSILKEPSFPVPDETQYTPPKPIISTTTFSRIPRPQSAFSRPAPLSKRNRRLLAELSKQTKRESAKHSFFQTDAPLSSSDQASTTKDHSTATKSARYLTPPGGSSSTNGDMPGKLLGVPDSSEANHADVPVVSLPDSFQRSSECTGRGFSTVNTDASIPPAAGGALRSEGDDLDEHVPESPNEVREDDLDRPISTSTSPETSDALLVMSVSPASSPAREKSSPTTDQRPLALDSNAKRELSVPDRRRALWSPLTTQAQDDMNMVDDPRPLSPLAAVVVRKDSPPLPKNNLATPPHVPSEADSRSQDVGGRHNKRFELDNVVDSLLSELPALSPRSRSRFGRPPLPTSHGRVLRSPPVSSEARRMCDFDQHRAIPASTLRDGKNYDRLLLPTALGQQIESEARPLFTPSAEADAPQVPPMTGATDSPSPCEEDGRSSTPESETTKLTASETNPQAEEAPVQAREQPSDSMTEVSSPSCSAVQARIVPSGRRRGRPRKKPAITTVAPAGPKRGRGRPKKVIALSEVSRDDESVKEPCLESTTQPGQQPHIEKSDPCQSPDAMESDSGRKVDFSSAKEAPVRSATSPVEDCSSDCLSEGERRESKRRIKRTALQILLDSASACAVQDDPSSKVSLRTRELSTLLATSAPDRARSRAIKQKGGAETVKKDSTSSSARSEDNNAAVRSCVDKASGRARELSALLASSSLPATCDSNARSRGIKQKGGTETVTQDSTSSSVHSEDTNPAVRSYVSPSQSLQDAHSRRKVDSLPEKNEVAVAPGSTPQADTSLSDPIVEGERPGIKRRIKRTALQILLDSSPGEGDSPRASSRSDLTARIPGTLDRQRSRGSEGGTEAVTKEPTSNPLSANKDRSVPDQKSRVADSGRKLDFLPADEAALARVARGTTSSDDTCLPDSMAQRERPVKRRIKRTSLQMLLDSPSPCAVEDDLSSTASYRSRDVEKSRALSQGGTESAAKLSVKERLKRTWSEFRRGSVVRENGSAKRLRHQKSSSDEDLPTHGADADSTEDTRPALRRRLADGINASTSVGNAAVSTTSRRLAVRRSLATHALSLQWPSAKIRNRSRKPGRDASHTLSAHSRRHSAIPVDCSLDASNSQTGTGSDTTPRTRSDGEANRSDPCRTTRSTTPTHVRPTIMKPQTRRGIRFPSKVVRAMLRSSSASPGVKLSSTECNSSGPTCDHASSPLGVFEFLGTQAPDGANPIVSSPRPSDLASVEPQQPRKRGRPRKVPLTPRGERADADHQVSPAPRSEDTRMSKKPADTSHARDLSCPPSKKPAVDRPRRNSTSAENSDGQTRNARLSAQGSLPTRRRSRGGEEGCDDRAEGVAASDADSAALRSSEAQEKPLSTSAGSRLRLGRPKQKKRLFGAGLAVFKGIRRTRARASPSGEGQEASSSTPATPTENRSGRLGRPKKKKRPLGPGLIEWNKKRSQWQEQQRKRNNHKQKQTRNHRLEEGAGLPESAPSHPFKSVGAPTSPHPAVPSPSKSDHAPSSPQPFLSTSPHPAVPSPSKSDHAPSSPQPVLSPPSTSAKKPSAPKALEIPERIVWPAPRPDRATSVPYDSSGAITKLPPPSQGASLGVGLEVWEPQKIVADASRSEPVDTSAESEWPFYSEGPAGDMVEALHCGAWVLGRIVRAADDGVTVRLEGHPPGFDMLAPRSHVSWQIRPRRKHVSQITGVDRLGKEFYPGDRVEAKTSAGVDKTWVCARVENVAVLRRTDEAQCGPQWVGSVSVRFEGFSPPLHRVIYLPQEQDEICSRDPGQDHRFGPLGPEFYVGEWVGIWPRTAKKTPSDKADSPTTALSSRGGGGAGLLCLSADERARLICAYAENGSSPLPACVMQVHREKADARTHTYTFPSLLGAPAVVTAIRVQYANTRPLPSPLTGATEWLQIPKDLWRIGNCLF
eukprot:Rmarinus@m.4712